MEGALRMSRLRQWVGGTDASGSARALIALVSATVASGAVALAIPQWSKVFADGGHVLAMVIAIVTAAVAALITRQISTSTAPRLAIGVATLALFLGLWYNTAIADLPGDLIGSWKAVASTGLLLPTEPRFVLVPVVLAWAGTWLATTLSLERGTSAAAAIPLAAVHGATLAYTVVAGEPSLWQTVAVGAAVLALIALGSLTGVADSRPPEDKQAADSEKSAVGALPVRWRQLAWATPLILAAGLFGALADRAASNRSEEAFDLRERLVRPLDIFEEATPLSRVKGGLVDATPETVFVAELQGLGPEDEVRLFPVATLDRYDGTVWTSSARFEAAGAALPLPSQVGAIDDRRFSQHIELSDAYPFRFLPRAGTVRSSETDDLSWDPRSGSLARTDDSRSPLVFDIDLQLADTTLPDEPVVTTLNDAVRAAATPPSLSDDQAPVFGAFIAEASEGATSEFDRLVRLQDALRSDEFGYNENAAAGHSLAALTSYLDPGDGRAPIGFAEQAASVFALTARQSGSASRVVVGYRLPDPTTADSGPVVVTEDMIHAWPEVWIDGVGWYAFEPTNTGNETTEQAARTPAVSAEGQDAQAADLPDIQEPVLIPDPLGEDGGLGRWALPLALATVPLFYLALVWLWKRLRSSRRRRLGSPAARTVGASLATRDRLAALGLPHGDHLSLLDLADELDVIDLRDVADPIAEMAPLVDRALFSPDEPTGSMAEAAWASASTAMNAAGAARPFKAKLRALVDPRH